MSEWFLSGVGIGEGGRPSCAGDGDTTQAGGGAAGSGRSLSLSNVVFA